MKKHLLTSLLYLLPIFTIAQGLVRSDTISLPIQLSLEKGQPVLKSFLEQQDNSVEYLPLLRIENFQLAEADALIDYDLAELKPNFYYNIHLLIESRDTFEDAIIPNFRELEGINGTLNWREEAPFQTKWLDVLEGKLEYNEVYDLKIQYDLYGDLDCEQVPKPNLSLQKNWYHYLLSATGIAMIGTGQYYGNQADLQEAEYLEKWRDGDRAEVAAPILEAANQNIERHNLFSNVGIGVIAIQGVIASIQYTKYRKRKKAYQSYCSKKVNTDLSVQYLQGQPFLGLTTTVQLSKE